MESLRVVELTAPDQPGVRDSFEVRRAVRAADRPDDAPVSWLNHEARPLWPWPGTAERSFAVYRGDVAVAWADVDLPLADNRDVAEVELEVHPAHRRTGLGRELLERLRPELVEAGRKRLLVETDQSTGAEAFLEQAGGRRVIADTQRRLDLAAADSGDLGLPTHEELLADARAHAAGYELVQWTGPTPEADLDDDAVLQGRMSTDAPLDDLAWEPEEYDAGRSRARDAMMAGRGLKSYVSAARHRDSGRLVGVTRVVVSADVREHGDQWETIVLPEHRGHRLGMLLKVENLRLARRHEPAMRWVDTFNADSNAPMLRVNVAMGFRPVRRWSQWELTL
jgi:GNAT superfamily N-acetyltransferase